MRRKIPQLSAWLGAEIGHVAQVPSPFATLQRTLDDDRTLAQFDELRSPLPGTRDDFFELRHSADTAPLAVGFAFEDVSMRGLTRGITFRRPNGACWRVLEVPFYGEQLELFLLRSGEAFPDPVQFGDQEIVAISDSPPDGARILDAYAKGAVPAYAEGNRLRLWYSPMPRGIFDIESPNFHLHERLLRTVRSGRYHVRFDTAFEDVIRYCATVERPRESVPWLLPELVSAFVDAHRLGHAHSVETWREGRLVGGLYGLAIGRIFFAESAFHLETDASKVAFAELVVQLRARGFVLIDTRTVHPHTTRLGATEIPRDEFLERLRTAVQAPGFTGPWTEWAMR